VHPIRRPRKVFFTIGRLWLECRGPHGRAREATVLHQLMQTWFEWVRDGGYPAIFFLMAMESSIFPVPSELVVPPAAYWAAQGVFSMTGVWLASTLGSLFGSLVTYAAARAVGRPFIERYGKYLFMPPDKVASAEAVLSRFSAGGIFFSRLLPVVRHLCSIPAGLVRMPLVPFSVLTTVGAGLWCGVLAWFGREVIGNEPTLLSDPDALVKVLKKRLVWFVVGVAVLAGSYFAMKWLSRRAPAATPAGE
jgi:membrane protein DedA with SNARE-associated domain